jgi:hypothetical protein
MLKRQNLPDLYLEDALPFLEAVIEEAYESYPSVVEQVFNVKDMKNGIAQHTQVSALSAASEVGEGEEIPQDRVYSGYSKTYLARKFGILLATSQEAIDDERFDSISKNASKLGRAIRSAMEIDGASVFNNGFATAGLDGQTLFSTAHPLLSPGAGTSSNRLAVAADLSVTSLKDLITVFKEQLDTSANKIMINPKALLVPSELEYLAYELLKSTYLPEGSNNNLSSIGPSGRYKIEPVCWEYLTDSDAFFLVADKSDHEIYHFWSKQPEIKQEIDFKTDVALTRILARWDVGYSDWRGVCGSPGV